MPTGDEKILFIDDEKALVDLGYQILERLGYDVTTRTSSVEALELFIAQPEKFDLVITDMTMPNMTGDELAGKLMKIRADIPVILCTGYSERISQEKAHAIGIKEFVLKPIVMSALAVTVRTVLDQSVKGRK
jgi:two-component system cell cycle sensor histidine kinase/response regulator CckA